MKQDTAVNIIPNYSYHYDEPWCLSKLENAILDHMLDLNSPYHKELVYLCIGTDRATGDCLGPLVGTRLKSLSPSAHIYGTLEMPVHAINLSETIENINQAYNAPLIIAIDASLGNTDKIGFINVKSGAIKPGTALKKVLPEVGDFHISGVVNVGGFLESMVLQNTRLHLVYKMANIIAQSLYLANYKYQRNHSNYISSPAFNRF